MVGSVILHQGISSGTFGFVYAAVDTRTGDPIAVKELVVKDRHAARNPELKSEIRVAQAFQVSLPFPVESFNWLRDRREIINSHEID